ncbi:MAG: lipopolysaccharide biosynthesis protein [Candidatus Omnitrophota bacterium]
MSSSDSLKKRYLYKVFGNGMSMAAGAVTQAVIPRCLGALQYGNFCFLTDFFLQIMGFLNAGSSTGFYTKLSKRPCENKLVLFYLGYIFLAVMAGLLMVSVAAGLGWERQMWPGQTLKYVYAGGIFAGLNWLSSSMNDTVDAYGITVAAEKARMVQRIGGVVLVLIMMQYQMISLDTVFYFNYVIFLVAILFFVYLARQGGFPLKLEKMTTLEAGAYAGEFYRYSKPLFMYALVAFGIGLFDRWFLQVMAGGVQQGFYGLSFKIGALCFLLTGPMTQLITREFSIAYQKKDFGEIARLFRRHIPLLYGVTASIACFVAMNADKVAIIMGGREFKGATLAVVIMALYPIHQTYGQLSNAVFFATDQTRLYRNISVASMLVGIPATYFLLASPVNFGLGAGAVGLAAKVVAFNVVTVNVCLYFNARFLHLPFGWYLRHQLLSVLAFAGMAFVSTFIVERCWAGGDVVFRFLIAGAIYFVVIAASVFLVPGFLGLKRGDIGLVMHKMMKSFSGSSKR